MPSTLPMSTPSTTFMFGASSPRTSVIVRVVGNKAMKTAIDCFHLGGPFAPAGWGGNQPPNPPTTFRVVWRVHPVKGKSLSVPDHVVVLHPGNRLEQLGAQETGETAESRHDVVVESDEGLVILARDSL